jgi:hypothetical protein
MSPGRVHPPDPHAHPYAWWANLGMLQNRQLQHHSRFPPSCPGTDPSPSARSPRNWPCFITNNRNPCPCCIVRRDVVSLETYHSECPHVRASVGIALNDGWLSIPALDSTPMCLAERQTIQPQCGSAHAAIRPRHRILSLTVQSAGCRLHRPPAMWFAYVAAMPQCCRNMLAIDAPMSGSQATLQPRRATRLQRPRYGIGSRGMPRPCRATWQPHFCSISVVLNRFAARPRHGFSIREMAGHAASLWSAMRDFLPKRNV